MDLSDEVVPVNKLWASAENKTFESDTKTFYHFPSYSFNML